MKIVRGKTLEHERMLRGKVEAKLAHAREYLETCMNTVASQKTEIAHLRKRLWEKETPVPDKDDPPSRQSTLCYA